MLFKTSFTALVVASLAVLSTYTPQVEAHSWMDCVDWKFKNSKVQDWSDKGGKCQGYARRFPLGKAFGSLDSDWPSRHYQQTHKNPDPNHAVACSDRKHGAEKGADETRANPVSAAYGGKFGRMTVTSVGDTLCVRWPAKNHGKSGESKTTVQINLSKVRNGKDISQADLLKNTIAKLPYKNCMKGSNEDRRACGGCFKVPTRASGVYLLQWRWMLNKGEWYTSCADIQIGK
ncbi:hypothetical protein BC939DRAFT_500481 [Gamsiella multidivaricata]|uniref:uncharacterized protein n=1 Tax=Gamsiella multidivaricata TaxID=101098 RepID=UPI002220A6B9|nr:uncharacterized protein BC939DRAFT_500481 [Gamsiella multidivaricata]KAG0366559.1 hypothetical protein BGZ54_005194 [Gamsiella multidivaricata]KAI7828687.1 hypothetical protein BC939DRAFT_500481 [Gamsiella multidivaricata]